VQASKSSEPPRRAKAPGPALLPSSQRCWFSPEETHVILSLLGFYWTLKESPEYSSCHSPSSNNTSPYGRGGCVFLREIILFKVKYTENPLSRSASEHPTSGLFHGKMLRRKVFPFSSGMEDLPSPIGIRFTPLCAPFFCQKVDLKILLWRFFCIAAPSQHVPPKTADYLPPF